MRIELNISEMNEDDAASLMALLIVRFPSAMTALDRMVLPSVTHQVGDVSVTGRGVEGIQALAEEVFAPPPSEEAGAVFASPSADGAAAPAGSTEPPISEPAAASAPPPPPAGVELDKDGLPWDGRIHARTKAKIDDGSWRKRRGVTEAELASVTAELRATMAARPTVTAIAPSAAPPPATSASAAPASGASPVPPASSPPTPSPVPAVTDGEAHSPPGEAAPAAAAPPPASAPASAAPPAAPPPSEAPPAAQPAAGAEQPPHVAFGAVMRKVTELQTAGRLTPEAVASAVASVGLESVAALLHRPDLIPTFETVVLSMAAPAAA